MCNPLNYDLQPSIALFERYLTAARQQNPSEIHPLLGAEALARLDQMQFLLGRVATIQQHVLGSCPISLTDLLLPIEPPPSASFATDTGRIRQQTFFHVRLYTETFYYIAFRFREILTKPNKLTKQYALPHLRAFEALGVVSVRNQLLEHPDGPKSQVFSQDHSLGGPNGPQLKLDEGNSSYTDKGLFANASELNNHLDAVLTAALAALSINEPRA